MGCQLLLLKERVLCSSQVFYALARTVYFQVFRESVLFTGRPCSPSRFLSREPALSSSLVRCTVAACPPASRNIPL